MSLFALIGAADNLDEPTPLINRRTTIFGLVITSLIVTSLCVTFRLYVRFFVTRCPGWDDLLVVLLIITTWITNVGSCILTNNGLGKHFILLGPDGMTAFVKTFWWCNGCYNMALALVKLSLLFQYLRLLDEHPDTKQPKTRIAIVVLIIATSIWGLVYSILAWVPCIPVDGHWHFSESAARYGYGSDEVGPFVATYITHGACNMVIDIAVLAIPVFSRSMWATADEELRSRLAMIFLYILGGLQVSSLSYLCVSSPDKVLIADDLFSSVVCSVIRFILIVHTRATTSPTFDPSWYGASTCILSILEVDLATVVASLPVFWPHLRRNIKIIITREVEVKVTHEPRAFTLIEEENFQDGKRSEANGGYGGDTTSILPWESQAKNASTKTSDTIMLQDMHGIYSNSNKQVNAVRLFNPHNSSHSRSISNPIDLQQLSRDSKETLLR